MLSKALQKTFFSRLILFTVVATLYACGDSATCPMTEIEVANISFAVEVYSAETDEVIDAATISYTKDGGDLTELECTAFTRSNARSLSLSASCESYPILDGAGEYDLTVSADGFQDFETSLEVVADECGFVENPQTIRAELSPE